MRDVQRWVSYVRGLPLLTQYYMSLCVKVCGMMLRSKLDVGEQDLPLRFCLYVGHLRGFTLKGRSVTKGKGGAGTVSIEL